MVYRSLVVVGHFNVEWTGFTPAKADPILLVDPNTVLPGPVAAERLESIARRNLQFFQRIYRVKLIQLSCRNPPQRSRTSLSGSLGVDAVEDVLRGLVSKRGDHRHMVARISCYASRVRMHPAGTGARRAFSATSRCNTYSRFRPTGDQSRTLLLGLGSSCEHVALLIRQPTNKPQVFLHSGLFAGSQGVWVVLLEQLVDHSQILAKLL